jgi:hypothetical protein
MATGKHVDLSLYYMAPEHQDRIDAEVPSVRWKSARRRINEASAEASKI